MDSENVSKWQHSRIGCQNPVSDEFTLFTNPSNIISVKLSDYLSVYLSVSPWDIADKQIKLTWR